MVSVALKREHLSPPRLRAARVEVNATVDRSFHNLLSVDLELLVLSLPSACGKSTQRPWLGDTPLCPFTFAVTNRGARFELARKMTPILLLLSSQKVVYFGRVWRGGGRGEEENPNEIRVGWFRGIFSHLNRCQRRVLGREKKNMFPHSGQTQNGKCLPGCWTLEIACLTTTNNDDPEVSSAVSDLPSCRRIVVFHLHEPSTRTEGKN